MNFLLVGLGAALGAMLRYAIASTMPLKEFPWATAIINLSGSFFLGCVAAYWSKDHPARLLLGIGLLGGYTTYSTFALDVLEQLKNGQYLPAIGNTLMQACGSIVACGLGFAIVTKFTK